MPKSVTKISTLERGAKVLLPIRAQAPFTIRDERSGLSIRAVLNGTRSVPAEVSGAYVVYRGAHASGADHVHRVTVEGTEDFLLFERAPASPEISYRVELGKAVAGLRLVANTLEVLDAKGAPRLRVEAPYLVDAEGTHHAAHTSVEGCAVDTNPIGPWHRQLTAPQAKQCVLRVTWDDGPIVYPAVLDPTWSTTGSLTNTRYNHVSTALADGRVLVAGGENTASGDGSAELYDPPTGTWSTTGNPIANLNHLSLLPDGRVLATTFAAAQLYEPSTGSWTATGSLNLSRTRNSASVLADGRVLVTGGFASGVGERSSAELYDPSTGTWSLTGEMAQARDEHTASLLADGRILVTGGAVGTTTLQHAELYDPSTGTWSTTAEMPVRRADHTASVLADGRVLVAGGYNGTSSPTVTDLYDPSTGTWSATGALPYVRVDHTASLLHDGSVLIAGGYDSPGYSAASPGAALYAPLTGTWKNTASMAVPRSRHTANLLPDGTVLLAGGSSNTYPDGKATAERFGGANGDTCDAGGHYCLSGHCEDGVCCETACEGGCKACDLPDDEGICSPKATNTPCNDGDMATMADECTSSGECQGWPYSCSPGPCEATSVPNGIDCDVSLKPDGTSCDDGLGGTKNDSCVATGSCLGEAYTCTPGSCESSFPNGTDCDVTPKTAGSSCDDGDLQTKDDKCEAAGSCVGTTYTCTPGPCEESSEGNGVGCDVLFKAAGSVCDDANLDTKGDVCDGQGSCSGVAYTCISGPCEESSTPDGNGCVVASMPDGSSCDDNDSCTDADQCVAGACQGAVVACEAGEACVSSSGCLATHCTSCTMDRDCGSDAVCSALEGGRLCLRTCLGDSDCAGDQVCTTTSDGAGGKACFDATGTCKAPVPAAVDGGPTGDDLATPSVDNAMATSNQTGCASSPNHPAGRLWLLALLLGVLRWRPQAGSKSRYAGWLS